MKKIAAILMVVAVTGCSSMGMGSSGMSSMGAGMGSRGTSVNQNPVIDSNGNLNIYHGG